MVGFTSSTVTRISVLVAMLALALPYNAQAAALRQGSGTGLPAYCSTSFDPYKVPLAKVQACGMHVFPRQTVKHLANGATEYVYSLYGHTAVYRIPPAGFDITRASASTLRFYGIPEAPAKPGARADWIDFMRRMHLITPPATLIAGSVPFTQSAWAGYVATSSSSSSYHEVQSFYYQPSVHSTSCTNNGSSQWVGLGGYGTSDLAQDGTALVWPGLAKNQAWEEILPDQPSPIAQNLYATAGGEFLANVNKIPSGFSFYLGDKSSGKSVSFSISTSSYNGSSAEAIVERPGNHYLLNFQSVLFTATTVNGSNYGIGTFSHTAISQINGLGHTLAHPGSLSNSGQNFTDYWDACN